MLTYSVLFPPLAALLTPDLAPARRRRSRAHICSTGSCATHWGERARLASLWFAVLGIAGAARERLARVRARRGVRARRAARSADAASALVGSLRGARLRAREPGRGRVPRARRWSPAGSRAEPRAHRARRRGGAVRSSRSCCSRSLFPEGGRFPFWFSAYWPLALTCGLALLAIRGPRRGARAPRGADRLPRRSGTLLWLVPNPVGGNMTRLGSLFAGPVLGRGRARTARDGRRARCRGRGARRGARLAGRDSVAGHLPEPRRSLDGSAVLPAARELAPAHGGAARPHRDPLHVQPLGDRLPGAAISSSRGAGCASPTSRATRSSTRAPDERPLPPLAARERHLVRRAGGRAARLLGAAGGGDSSAASRPTCGCARTLGALARLRGARHRPRCCRRERARSARLASLGPESFTLAREPARETSSCASARRPTGGGGRRPACVGATANGRSCAPRSPGSCASSRRASRPHARWSARDAAGGRLRHSRGNGFFNFRR